MNQQIITTSSMIRKRETQPLQGSNRATANNPKHYSVRALQTFLTALTMLFTLAVNGAWGEELFSMSAKKDAEYSTTNGQEISMTSTHATIVGGTVVIGSKRASDASNDDKFEKNSGFYFGTTNIYIKITLDKNLAVGDVIQYTSDAAANNLCFTKTNSRNTTIAGTTTTTTQTYIISESDGFAGTNVLYIWRATGNSHYWDNLTITRPSSGSADPDPEPTAPEWESIELTLNAEGLLLHDELVQGTDVDFDISLDNEGNVIRVEKGASNAIGSITGKYHSNHGMNPFSMKLNVPGPVKITSGTCSYGTVQVMVNGSAVGDAVVGDNSTKCWKNDKANIATGIYTGEAGEITITNGSYCPYLKIEKYEAPAVPDYTVTFSNTTEGVAGTVPSAVTKSEGATMTIPTNYTLYKDGYTLTGWSDGEKTYKAGDTYTFTKNETLTAVFTANTKTLEDRTEPVTLKWNFRTDQGAPKIASEGKEGLIYVTQTTIAGETIDVKLDFSTKPGKFNNTSSNDWAQVNNGTTFVLPSCKGATVSVESMNATTTTTVNGVAATGNAERVYSTTIDSDETTATVIIGDGNWYRYIQIVLPVPTAPAEKFDVSAELAAQNTPDGWTAVQLPDITLNKTITLGGLSATANNRSAIQDAIDAVNTAGGGKVIIPAGTWLSGPIVMKSNVVLHLNEGATLMAMPFGGVDYVGTSSDGEKYPWSGTYKKENNEDTTLKNYNTFITCASGAQNVVVEGDGVTSIIDGQGADWWPIYEQIGTRPPLIRFDNGSKFLVRKLKLQNAAGVNLTLGNGGRASNFTVHNVTISNPSSESEQLQSGEVVSHNTDGIPVWGPYANIYDCNISTGDDNIVADSHAHHLHAWNITCGYGHGMSMGSYTEDLHDVIYEDITFTGTSCGFRLKTNTGRSGNDTTGSNGAVKNIICRNATMTGVPSPIKITSWYDSDAQDPSTFSTPSSVADKTPEFCNILFQNITADAVAGKTNWKHHSPIYIYGRPEMPIHDVTFDNVKIASKRGMFLAYCNRVNFTNGCNIVNETNANDHIATQYLAEWNGSYVTAAPSYPRTVKWNFRNPIPQALRGWTLNKDARTHTLTSDIQTVQMVVDATNGKFWDNGTDWVQFNEGAKLNVPVISTSDVVTVTTYQNGTCTVGGESNASGLTVTHTATMEEVAAGFVEVVASSNGYIGTVQVTQNAPGTDLTPTWNETENRWEAKLGTTPAENAESMLFAISYVKNKEVKTLYLPNGTYDLGTEHNKLVPDGMTIIGESRDGVIIKNRPTVEGIGVTATLQTGSNVTLKNLTLNCRAPFSDTSSAERGVCLQDVGSATSVNHYENIVLDGLQDTYYSNGANGMTSIFDNCIIRGTVDFICGNGNVTFNDCSLQPVMPHNGSKPTIAAPSTFTEETGFVFNRCTVEAATTDIDCVGTGHATSAVTDYYLARAWYAGGETLKGTDRTPKAAFNSTTYTLAPNDAKWGGSIGYAQDSERREFSEGVYVPELIIADVIETTTWDWTKTGKTEVKFTEATQIKKDVDFVLSDENALGTPAEFNSAALIGCGEYAVRDGKYFQGSKIKFHTTIAGKVKVSFANTGNRKNQDGTENESQRRYLYVNGEKTQWGSCLPTDNDKTTDYIDVEAGDVVLTSKIEGQDADQYLRIFTVEFKANSDEPEPEPTKLSYKLDFTKSWNSNISSSGSASTWYVTSTTDDGVPTLSASQPETGDWMKFVGYNKGSGYGLYYNAYFEVPVKAAVYTLTLGLNDVGNDVSIINKETGAQIASINNKGSKFSENSNNVNSVTFTVKDNCTLLIKNPSLKDVRYPYFALQEDGPVPGRTFQDFKINFTNESGIDQSKTYYVTSTDADGVPTYTAEEQSTYLATFKGRYHNANYGITGNPVITIPVDGPVKIYYGTNDFGADVTVKNSADKVVGTMNTYGNKWSASKPEEELAFVTYNVEEATVLTLTGGGYIPFIKVEACEFIPTVDVTYYNTNGAVIGKETVNGSSALAYKYGESDVIVPDGSKFRGWFDKATNGKKVAEGTVLTENKSLYAVATPIEVAIPGKTFSYDLRDNNFYQEDHECISMDNGAFHDSQHGWQFSNNGTVTIPVAGNAKITLSLCQFGNGGTTTVTSSNGGVITPNSFYTKLDSEPGVQQAIEYTGPATTLTLTLGNGGYIHEVMVENYPIPESDLKVVEGKDVITLNPGGTYQLTKGEENDYTTSSEAAMTYVSDNAEMVTVSETGLLTAGTGFGQATITMTQAGNDKFQTGSVSFTVKVVSAHGQTAKPSATVGEDGKVYLKSNALDSEAKIYYTTDGTDPTDKSTEFTGESIEVDANTIVKAIAIYDDKSPSDIITAYVKVPVTLTWDWNSTTTYSVKPRYSNDDLKELFDNNTQANIGNNLEYKGTSSEVKGKDYKFTKFQLAASLPKGDKNSALQFNVLTKAGLYFKPTATSATVTRGGTNTTENVDISIADETTEKYLGEGLTPNRYDGSGTSTDGGATGYNTYSYDASNFTDIAMTSDLSMYIYTYKVAKDYYYADITIDGYISGSLYDGEFYNVGYDVEPAEGGYVVQKPSVSSVMAGKTVVFNATPAEGYKFVNWTKAADGTVLSTDKTFNRTITEDTYVTANFQKIPLVTFSKEEDIEGNVPAAQYVDGDTYELNIPVNYVLYRDGYTMTGWIAGDKIYELGMSHRFDEDVTLKPKFQRNEVGITDTNEKVTVRWDFNHRERPENAPELNVYTNGEPSEKSTGIYTRTVKVNGQPVDMKMDISAPADGTKLDNRDMTVPVATAQVNPGTKVTIPAVPGMKVILKASKDKDTRDITGRTKPRHTQFVEGTTIPSYFGDDTSANPVREDDYTASYIYNGDEETVTLTFLQIAGQGDWGFYEWIEVEYPVLQNVKLFNEITEKLDREKNENAGTLEITAKAPVHANTGKRYLAGDVVTISAEAKYGYTITGFKHNGVELPDPVIADGAKSATVDYTVVDGDNTVYAVYQRQQTYAVRVTTADLSLGEVTLDPIYENFLVRGKDFIEGHYVQGTEVKLKSEAGEGNVLSYWMDGGETWKDGEGNPTQTNPNVDITVGTDAEFYTAYFRPGEKGTVIFDMTDSGVYSVSDPNTYSGSVSMNPATLSGVRSFNVPTNFTFFKPGYTLLHWQVKGTADTYELGQRGSFTEENQKITLVPVFRENTATQDNRTNDPVIRYDFGTGIFSYDDPTKGETRKVSAQKVNIPKNTKTFWTSKVWTEVLNNSVKDKNWRDVAMWVNTGSKGFVRNGDLPEWAAFGPGTTFEVASGSGTKFSLMTYAPITTTTIDGVVPVLDETRSNPANHEYVYTYTTRSAEDRVKIVIGNDYSYYKWLEAATLAANMVDLHIKTTDNVVGEVTSVKSWDEENYPSKDLDDGGHSFQKGNKVVVTFYRKFGADFKQIIDPAKDNLPILEMLGDGKVRMVRLGDGTDLETLEPNNDGTWGGGNDHVFKLTKSDVDETEKAKGFLTKYVVEFEITNHRNLEIQFKEKPTYYVTYNTGKEAVGVAPSAAWVEAGDYYKISKNQTLYYEGHTLDHWEDLAGKEYEIGESYRMSPTEPSDMLLYPVFRQNTFSLLDLTADATATWELGRGNGAPVISYQRINGIYIAQVSNGKSEIDVKLDLMGVNGKIDNKSYDERAQINGGSIFRFPVTYGCVIGLNASSPSYQIETTKICGKNAAEGGYEKDQNVTSTYTGDAGEGDVVFADDGRFYTQFSITYKAQTETAQPTLTSVKYGETALTETEFANLLKDGSITLIVAPDVASNKVPVVAAVVENGKAQIEQATYQNPVATVTLKTDGGMSVKAYAINFQFDEPATAPALSSVKVKNATVTDGVADNAPVSGSIEITFDRVMKEVSGITPTSPGESLEAISAPQGKTLTFNYWNLPVNKNVTITIPANKLEDVYGKKYAEAITLTLHTAATNMDIEHKPFDYVVGYGAVSDLNAIIKAVNSNRETGRLRIFIPDGEYELTGNEKSSWKAGDETTDDNGVSMKIPAGGYKYDNHMTVISRANVSLIGQSQENTIIFNRPKYEGIGCTATIHVTGVDDYLEELTLENRFPYYKANFAGRAVAFWDQGNRQVLKNVSLLSYQDTYYSHGNGNYRGYFEDCVLAGTVDWLCGNGDIWLERCGIMIRNRSGNNIAAPATTTPWGYVFNNCRIYPEEGADLVVDKSYTLGRPWQGTPSATYLNTTFDVLPRDEGWQAMMESHVLKFHEYGSMDSYGHPISLGSRTLAGAAPLKGSDDLILTDEAARKYTIENVLGGGEAFDPRIYTQQIDAKSGAEKDANNTLEWDDQIEIDDDRLQWQTEPMALCYFVFKLNEQTGKWEYKTNIAQSTEDETVTGLSLEPYGNGFYCVRAANQRGGLGAPTKMMEYIVSSKYTLTIKEVGKEPGYGWSTICLPYNSKVPTVNINGEEKELKIYAANGDENFTKSEIVDDYKLFLKPVDVINKNMGYVVYGPVGQYTFSSSSHTSDVITILGGNPNEEAIPVGNNNCYVLSNKTTYGLGFYKFTGTTLAANRAWLPVDMVSTGTQTGVSNQAKAITFLFVEDDVTGLYDTPVAEVEEQAESIVDLHGRRINSADMRPGNVYIVNGKKLYYK